MVDRLKIVNSEGYRTINYNHATRILLYNGLRFKSRKFFGSSFKPAAVSLAITHRCNSHCVMCNLWKRSREVSNIQKLELSKQEIVDIFSRTLFSDLIELDLTGGEPHLRDDLVDIVLEIAAIRHKFLPKLQSIIVTSNGLLSDRIVANYRRILAALKGHGIDLVSVNSLDGMHETHDTIRGTKGAFMSVSQTIRGLMELRQEYPDFFMGIKTTILPQNIDQLQAILNFAIKQHLFHIISPVFFSAGRFRNLDKHDQLYLKAEDYTKILNFYNRPEFDAGYYYHQAKRLLERGRKEWTCTAGSDYLFIEFDGRVYPCELMSKAVGDLRMQSIESIWQTLSLKQWRQKINNLENCRHCCEPGAIRFSASIEGFGYRRFLTQLGRQQYQETLYGEGYSKYLA
jgi:MoaA/NifB/PqqE/SkfB family radical SAM enzyme